MSKCVILSGGEPDGFTLDSVKKGDYFICADCGCEYARKLDIVPDLIVGDFDSYKGVLPGISEIHRSVPEKDDTDTLLAVKMAIKRGFTEIDLYGALGGRTDHAIANVQTLLYAHENGCNMRIISSANELEVQGAGERSYERRDGWYFSVFAAGGEVFIERFTGVKYTLENYRMTPAFPIGVSNEITENCAVLRIKSGTALVVRSKM